MKFKVGDPVRKPEGYNYEPAVIVAAFHNLKNEERYVAEITEGQCAGMLHVFNGKQLEHADELTKWIDDTVYLDDQTKKRRDILLDNDRERLFFFYDPLDFDKDDHPTSMRCWLDECEGWKPEWHDRVVSEFCL